MRLYAATVDGTRKVFLASCLAEANEIEADAEVAGDGDVRRFLAMLSPTVTAAELCVTRTTLSNWRRRAEVETPQNKYRREIDRRVRTQRAKGKTAPEIALALGIHEATVRRAIKRITEAGNAE